MMKIYSVCIRVAVFFAFLAPMSLSLSSGAQTGSSVKLVPDSTGVLTEIAVRSASTGRIFDGVGAISGGGGNSRLLMDYPAAQRDQILDYLFKPGYGASLQILKIEIGGDANSTDGAEPSIEHTSGVVNCRAGYEFWLAEQAKQRNPNIKLYGLAWAAPGWIDKNTFWSQATIEYLMTWMGCAQSHGLSIDYLGGWNERGFDKTWFENLHTALAQKRCTTKIVGDDSGWDVAKAMVDDPKFASAIDIIGVHYSCQGGDGGDADSCHSTQNGLDTKKPLWDSENGSQDDNTGTGALIRAITRGYLDAKMTALLNWPLIAAITENLPYPTVGLMVAPQPWSGSYSIGSSLWAIAQVSQFTQPGWQFLDDSSGYLGRDRVYGSFITLKSPEGSDFSSIIETTTAKIPSTVRFRIDENLAKKPVHVWATNLALNAGNDVFVQLPDLNRDKTGQFVAKLKPNTIYTFSTLATAGKGTATGPPQRALGLPYRENFDQYGIGQEARYTSDMQGAFEVQPCAAARPGKCLQQMAATKPIEWQDDSDAFTLIGDPTWSNYTASVDVELVKQGTVELIGRADLQKRPQSHQQGYFFQVSDNGAWNLLKSNSDGLRTTLAQGTAHPLGVGSWHRLSLSFRGRNIVALLDGQSLATLQDSSYYAGQVGLGVVGYDTDQFDNLSIEPR